MCWSSMSFEVNAVIATGTFCIDSSTRRAVTVIASIAAPCLTVILAGLASRSKVTSTKPNFGTSTWAAAVTAPTEMVT